MNRDQLQAVAQKLASAQHVAVLTGAGISKESGIPTFRDAQTGLWAQFEPEDLASPQGFRKNPKRVWEWYDFRRNTVWTVKPNPGHYALETLESHLESRDLGFTLITQNIDNLHQEAGNRRILELHGNIFRYKCLDSHHPVLFADFEHSQELPPRCKQCNAYVRPDVVWFGEALPERILAEAFDVASRADVMLVIGTSGAVHPAASLPAVAHRNGAYVAEVNPEESALTSMMDAFLQGPSGIILPELVSAMKAMKP